MAVAAATSAVAAVAATWAVAVACTWAAADLAARAWVAAASAVVRDFAGAPAAHVASPGFSGARVADGNWNGGGNWRGGNFRHRGFGPGFAAGAFAGAALGSYAYYSDPYYYDNGSGYYADNGYYDDGATVVVPGGGGMRAIARSATGPGIRVRRPISATTATGIPARKRIGITV